MSQHGIFFLRNPFRTLKLLFLFQLCDNFKGLEKANKMVLMMHSGDRVFRRSRRINSLGGWGSRESLSCHPGPSFVGVFTFLLF